MIESNLKLLGTRLAELRHAKGLSAADVAHQALGYAHGSHVAVSRLERAILARPSKDHLSRLAAFFGVEPDFLFVDQAQDDAAKAAPPAAVKSAAPRRAPTPRSIPSGGVRQPRATRALTRPAAKPPQQLHERIEHVRVKAGLDAAAFATALSAHGALITRTDVLAWESAERTPNPIQLRALGRLADCDENWFLTGASAHVEVAAPRATAWLGASATAA